MHESRQSAVGSWQFRKTVSGNWKLETSLRRFRIAFILWLFAGTGVLSAWAQTDVSAERLTAFIGSFVALSVVGLGLSAFFSSAEVAFLSANRPRLQALSDDGNVAAKAALRLYTSPERTQAAILIGTNLVNSAATAISLMLLNRLATGSLREWNEAINTFLMTPLVLIIGEILPKSLARSRPDGYLLAIGGVLVMTDTVLRPVSFLMLQWSLLWMRLSGQKGEAHIVTREDLRILAELSEKGGAIQQEQRRMIHAVLELDEQRVSQVMRPLGEMKCVAEGTTLGEFLAVVEEHGYSRIPVYRDRIDHIVGIVNVLDVIYGEDPGETIEPFIRRELLFVPETKRVATLLTELRFRRNPMAFVVNEYGGLVGLVTMEDLVEEIVGEIRDERDAAEPPYKVNQRTKTVECDGKMELEPLNELLKPFDLRIPDGDYETIAGFVVHALDRIPQANEVVEAEDFMVVVLAADERSVQRVRITKKGGRVRRRKA